MRKYNRKSFFPTSREVAELASHKELSSAEPPPAVVEALRRARDHFSRIAESITDVAYEYEGNRAGVSTDCDLHADEIDFLLSKLRYSSGSPGEPSAPYDAW